MGILTLNTAFVILILEKEAYRISTVTKEGITFCFEHLDFNHTDPTYHRIFLPYKIET